MKYFIYQSTLGNLRILYSDKGLVRVVLPYEEGSVQADLECEENETIKNYLEQYFSGMEPLPQLSAFDIKLTDFQKKVFELLMNTKRGTILTYGDVAKFIGCGSNQAIGQALKRNPVPIVIPCHRVVGKDWDGGYAGETSGVKIDFKKALLRLEQNTR